MVSIDKNNDSNENDVNDHAFLYLWENLCNLTKFKKYHFILGTPWTFFADMIELTIFSIGTHVWDNNEANLSQNDADKSSCNDSLVSCPLTDLIKFRDVNQDVLCQSDKEKNQT